MKVCLLPLALLFTLTLSAQQIEWMSWSEAMAANEKEPRKILVDVYTDWCGWCKKMDKSTFVDPKVVATVHKKFYAVKLDAEQKGTIDWAGHTFKFRADAGRKGVHELAVALLDSRMSYPSIVYLNEQQQRITIAPGFKAADAMLTELNFIGGEHYKTTTYAEFKKRAAKK